jgi:hypothetical protein
MDFLVENHGSIWLLRATSRRGKLFVRENIETPETQHWCGAVVVEPRYIKPLVDGLLAEGFRVAR